MSNTVQLTTQYTFSNPVTRYPKIHPPVQHQPGSGVDAAMQPRADHGESSYVGSHRLSGRKALISGGDSGIGAAVSIAFAREGADVAIVYLPGEERDIEHVRSYVEDAGAKIVLLPGDITDADFCSEAVERAAQGLGGLDILVNNAGTQFFNAELQAEEEADFDRTIRTNVYGTYHLTKAAIPRLPAGSTIINTTSVQAYEPSAGLADYAGTKAWINTFSKGLAMQLAPKGIRVNAVAPGPIWTPLQPSTGQKSDALPHFGEKTALGRPGQPAELAPAYVFLASAESSYVVGSTIAVTGGMPTP